MNYVALSTFLPSCLMKISVADYASIPKAQYAPARSRQSVSRRTCRRRCAGQLPCRALDQQRSVAVARRSCGTPGAGEATPPCPTREFQI